jgi:hypothetical protein
MLWSLNPLQPSPGFVSAGYIRRLESIFFAVNRGRFVARIGVYDRGSEVVLRGRPARSITRTHIGTHVVSLSSNMLRASTMETTKVTFTPSFA